MRKINTNYNLIKTLLCGSVLFFYTNCLAQSCDPNIKHSWEMGPYAGVSNFKGDIAPNIKFSNINYSFGGTIKYNPDYFSGIRLIVNSIGLSAKDSRVNRPLNEFRNEHFSANVVEVGGLYDYNFIPFTHPKQLINWSPFLVGGISLMYITANNNGVQNSELKPLTFALLLGGGSRIQLNPKWIINFEFIARKTYTDALDIPTSTYIDGTQKTISTNKDWVYTFQTGITYTFFKVMCPDPVKNI